MPQKKFALADLSQDDKRQLLSRAVSALAGDGYSRYIRDVYDTYLVYRDYDDDCTYRCDYTLADDYSVTLGTPTAVIERTVYEPVKMSAFALSPSYAQNNQVNVYANSLLFEIQGDAEHFPNQGITVSKQDLADIVAGFSGASMGLQHVDTPLGDNCGRVQSVWLDSTGRRLFGDVAVPKGLDALIPPGPRRVSVEISQDPATGKMSIPKVDLVLNPQIERAALMSLTAFAKGEGPTNPKENSPMPDQDKNAENKNAKPSLWDQVKALFTDAGVHIPDDSPPAHFSAGQVADFKRKAELFDQGMAKRREQAKQHATIGFSAEEAGHYHKLIEAAPEGLLFDDLETRMRAAAEKVAPPEGAARRTAPTQFGKDADAAPDRKDGKPEAPQLKPVDAVFADRAEQVKKGQ